MSGVVVIVVEFVLVCFFGGYFVLRDHGERPRGTRQLRASLQGGGALGVDPGAEEAGIAPGERVVEGEWNGRS